jgi:hypothetical protein
MSRSNNAVAKSQLVPCFVSHHKGALHDGCYAAVDAERGHGRAAGLKGLKDVAEKQKVESAKPDTVAT